MTLALLIFLSFPSTVIEFEVEGWVMEGDFVYENDSFFTLLAVDKDTNRFPEKLVLLYQKEEISIASQPLGIYRPYLIKKEGLYFFYEERQNKEIQRQNAPQVLIRNDGKSSEVLFKTTGKFPFIGEYIIMNNSEKDIVFTIRYLDSLFMVHWSRENKIKKELIARGTSLHLLNDDFLLYTSPVKERPIGRSIQEVRMISLKNRKKSEKIVYKSEGLLFYPYFKKHSLFISEDKDKDLFPERLLRIKNNKEEVLFECEKGFIYKFGILSSGSVLLSIAPENIVPEELYWIEKGETSLFMQKRGGILVLAVKDNYVLLSVRTGKKSRIILLREEL